LAQPFLGIQQNQCFAVCQRRRLCDDVFSTLADEFGDFGAVIGTALKERNQTIGCKKDGGISAYMRILIVNLYVLGCTLAILKMKILQNQAVL